MNESETCQSYYGNSGELTAWTDTPESVRLDADRERDTIIVELQPDDAVRLRDQLNVWIERRSPT